MDTIKNISSLPQFDGGHDNAFGTNKKQLNKSATRKLTNNNKYVPLDVKIIKSPVKSIPGIFINKIDKNLRQTNVTDKFIFDLLQITC